MAIRFHVFEVEIGVLFLFKSIEEMQEDGLEGHCVWDLDVGVSLKFVQALEEQEQFSQPCLHIDSQLLLEDAAAVDIAFIEDVDEQRIDVVGKLSGIAYQVSLLLIHGLLVAYAW